MMQKIVILAFSLSVALFAQPSFARLGETLDECEARYGFRNGQIGANAYTFNQDHILITVVFKNDRSVCEMYTSEASSSMSEEQVLDILNTNSSASSWTITLDKPGFRKYTCFRAATAVYAWQPTSDGSRFGKSLIVRSWPSSAKEQSGSEF
jgi:hypothetical protein